MKLLPFLARIAALILAAMLAAAPAGAQRLSDRTIFIVVPFTPGTGIDVLARIVGEELRQRWNQAVVIENKPGASGNIGTQAASRAEPDGHTIMMTVNTFVMNASLFRSLPYEPPASISSTCPTRARRAP
jgi:tripartite-type tricarboxylate transporter receptor subunit TctC